ncbi:MAG: sulfotransferase family 2 domain-containing protein [Paracoccus sp. (in: a-proteobacteria)]
MLTIRRINGVTAIQPPDGLDCLLRHKARRPPSFGFDNRGASDKGMQHLTLKLNGIRIRYACISRNGSSAFKLALGHQPDTPLAEIVPENSSRWYHHHDATIFVWRDPQERLLSLYRSKILDGKDNASLLRCYYQVMGTAPSDFENFVRFAASYADPHCLPQSAHLMPVIYTHAIRLDQLYLNMMQMVGPYTAAPFARRSNRSDHHPVKITPFSRALIQTIYACDYRMIDRITGKL